MRWIFSNVLSCCLKKCKWTCSIIHQCVQSTDDMRCVLPHCHGSCSHDGPSSYPRPPPFRTTLQPACYFIHSFRLAFLCQPFVILISSSCLPTIRSSARHGIVVLFKSWKSSASVDACSFYYFPRHFFFIIFFSAFPLFHATVPYTSSSIHSWVSACNL